MWSVVDIEKHKRYPFEFIQADALTVPLDGFDFIWASPPCQGYTAMRHAPGAVGVKSKLIDPIRERLIASGVPWVIENVEEARWAMRDPITLCGSMFGLGAQGCRLQRHRLFECSFPVEQPECHHNDKPVIGVYGGHARRRAASAGGRGTKTFGRAGHKVAAQSNGHRLDDVRGIERGNSPGLCNFHRACRSRSHAPTPCS